jgi:hypothetical protein
MLDRVIYGEDGATSLNTVIFKNVYIYLFVHTANNALYFIH